MGYTTKYIRERFDLTQKEIAAYWDIPIRTVENWDHRMTMPKYISNMMLDALITRYLKIEEQYKAIFNQILTEEELNKKVKEHVLHYIDLKKEIKNDAEKA